MQSTRVAAWRAHVLAIACVWTTVPKLKRSPTMAMTGDAMAVSELAITRAAASASSSWTPAISLAAAMRDPQLLGGPFTAPSFWTWHTLAKVLSGETLDEREAKLFRECTGRTRLPSGPVRRAVVLVGRRGGKDRFLSGCAVHRAALAADWRTIMSAGEQAVVSLLGADKKQAGILRRYCEGLLRAPLLAREVVRSTDDVIEFRNGAVLEVSTNDARLVRGRSAVAVLGSECCYWRTDEVSASSDEEVVAAAEPSMAMCPDGGLLLLGSSVYRRRGFMFRKWKELHGNDDAEDICWLAPSAVMNPARPGKVVDRAMADDPARARSEYLSEWRDDLANYIPRELIEAAIDRHVVVRPPDPRRRYTSFVDASSGLGDSFAAAVTHREGDRVVLDSLVEVRPPFDTAAATAQIAATLRSYGLRDTMGDDYAKGWVIREFARHGVIFKPRPTGMDRSALYLEVLPAFSAGRVHLLDSPKLVSQFCALERRVMPGGRDRVDHPNRAGHHDDLANATAGAIWRATARPQPLHISEAAMARSRQPTRYSRPPRWFF